MFKPALRLITAPAQRVAFVALYSVWPSLYLDPRNHLQTSSLSISQFINPGPPLLPPRGGVLLKPSQRQAVIGVAVLSHLF